MVRPNRIRNDRPEVEEAGVRAPGGPYRSERSGAPSRLWLLSGLWLVLLCWLSFFNGLGVLGLMDKTEALFVEVGHQMLERGDWITPWWNGERFFDYPVWGYWMVALSFRLFGVTEWAARFPVALAASAVVVAVFALVLLWAPGSESRPARFSRAALSAGVMATTPGWIGWGRTSTTDMFLSSAIALALFGFLVAHRFRSDSRMAALGRLAMALFAGIAVLAKGPVGLLLPALVVAVFLTLTGQWRGWLQPRILIPMTLLFLGVTMPWYAAASQTNGMAFLGGFLGFSNLQRFTSVLYAHPGPPWFYLPWVMVLLLPWSLFLPAALGHLRFWRRDRWRPANLSSEGNSEIADQLPLFLLLWLLLMVAFFSAAATKLPGYILPALPAASLLVALYFRPFPRSSIGSVPWDPTILQDQSLRRSAWIDALVLGAMAAAATLSPHWVGNDPAHPEFANALRRSGLPLTLALLLVLSSLVMVVLLRSREGARWLWVPNLAGFLAILALVIPPLAPLLDRERQLPVRQLAQQARMEALPGEPLWVVGTKRYSTLFYGEQTAAFVSGPDQVVSDLHHNRSARGNQSESPSVRLLGDRRDLERLGLDPGLIQRLARRGQQELWRVRRPDGEPR